MFSKLNNQIDTIFLDTESTNFEIENKVNIILSPALYWVKRVKLPVKNLRDAKPLLQSIFEDILPDGIYSYSAYKSEDYFFIFAYEDKKILDLLESKNLKLSQINNIHFAQSELSNITGAMKINQTQSIYLKDDIVVLLPCCWIKESGKLDITNLSLSKHTINLKHYNHLVDEKSLYTVVGLSILFTFLVLSQYLINIHKINKISDEKDEIFKTYSLKPTMMQNRSMLKEYETINKKQINLRKYISAILSLRLPNGAKLTLLNSNNKKLTAHFKGVKDKSKQIILKQLKHKNLKNSSKLKNNILVVEFKL